MGFVKFISGVIVGMLIILIVRNRREAKLKDQMKLKDDIFQIFEKSQDIIYYYKVKPYGQYLYISPLNRPVFRGGDGRFAEKDINAHFDFMHPDDIELKEKKLTGQLDYTQPIIERLKGTNGI